MPACPQNGVFMKRWFTVTLLVLSSLLAGCASTIRSQVTTFHEWPAALPDKSYVFERTREQNNNLEYRAYENLVRAELKRLGFSEAAPARQPTLKVDLDYGITVRDVREVYPVVVSPYMVGPPWYGYYGPFYDPFWYGPPIVERREENYQLFTRRLHITITRIADGRKLYDTTVISEGRNGSLAEVMPYLVRSAFADFPGKSGVPRVVELKMEK
jgi:hypothetical protein